MKSATLKRMTIEEYEFNRIQRAKLLNSLYYIIKEAENENNEDVQFIKEDIGHGEHIKGVMIYDINALSGMVIELGSDFHPDNMLRGMQAITQDEDGYCMSVLTTLDLNQAEIPNLSELVFRIMMINR